MAFRKLANPNPCPEGYDLHCYCDHENDQHSYDEFPHQYMARNQREAKAMAKKDGWRFHHDGTATCGKCMKRKKTETPAGPFRLDEESE